MLSRRTIVAALPALALAACAGGPDRPAAAPGLDWADARMDGRERSIAAAFLEALNEERAGRGLVRLIGDRALSQVSFDHSGSVFRRGVFNRTTPEDRYPYERLSETVRDRYLLLGGAQVWKVKGIGEWSAARLADRGVTSWMGEPVSRRFLLEELFNRTGVGVVEDEGDAVVTVVFGQIAG